MKLNLDSDMNEWMRNKKKKHNQKQQKNLLHFGLQHWHLISSLWIKINCQLDIANQSNDLLHIKNIVWNQMICKRNGSERDRALTMSCWHEFQFVYSALGNARFTWNCVNHARWSTTDMVFGFKWIDRIDLTYLIKFRQLRFWIRFKIYIGPTDQEFDCWI